CSLSSSLTESRIVWFGALEDTLRPRLSRIRFSIVLIAIAGILLGIPRQSLSNVWVSFSSFCVFLFLRSSLQKTNRSQTRRPQEL
ncbi:hypothetical protein KXW25_007888, partial [Aspergillus fumigatus]